MRAALREPPRLDTALAEWRVSTNLEQLDYPSLTILSLLYRNLLRHGVASALRDRWIVTKDEIDEPQSLSIKVWQNGKLAMSAHTSDMICGLREHIRFLTSVLTLRPGDLITTGTPAAVRKLSDGDHLKGSIEKIGEMELHVRAER